MTYGFTIKELLLMLWIWFAMIIAFGFVYALARGEAKGFFKDLAGAVADLWC